MIEIKNIRKSFGKLEVLKGIDLSIQKGEVVSIVGPSGAGKTTLLQIIGTLDRPDSGAVLIDSVDVTQLSQKKLSDFRNRHIGFVFQFHQLLPEFTSLCPKTGQPDFAEIKINYIPDQYLCPTVPNTSRTNFRVARSNA